jgi:hypothetical protein
MLQLKNENMVDTIIQSFWKYGYMTLSRRYGTYLPEPSKVGNYEVDAIGKQKKQYVIGITLSASELDDPGIYQKLKFLASRQNKYSRKNVKLFIAIPNNSLNKARMIISNLEDNIKKNIKLIPFEPTKFN